MGEGLAWAEEYEHDREDMRYQDMRISGYELVSKLGRQQSFLAINRQKRRKVYPTLITQIQ